MKITDANACGGMCKDLGAIVDLRLSTDGELVGALALNTSGEAAAEQALHDRRQCWLTPVVADGSLARVELTDGSEWD